jgi:hypothetical protein
MPLVSNGIAKTAVAKSVANCRYDSEVGVTSMRDCSHRSCSTRCGTCTFMAWPRTAHCCPFLTLC